MSSRPMHGFTLIELILVIVILGILSVTAAPKFINLTGDAHASTLQGVYGAVNSGKNLVYAKCLLAKGCNVKGPPAPGNGLGNSILVQGEAITLAYGYPRHTPAGIVRMVQIADTDDGGEFEITSYSAAGRPGIRIRPEADYAANQCEVRYSQPTAAGEEPLVEIELDNC